MGFGGSFLPLQQDCGRQLHWQASLQTIPPASTSTNDSCLQAALQQSVNSRHAARGHRNTPARAHLLHLAALQPLHAGGLLHALPLPDAQLGGIVAASHIQLAINLGRQWGA